MYCLAEAAVLLAPAAPPPNKALQLTGAQRATHGFGIMGSQAQLTGRSGRPAAERLVR